MHHCSCPIFAIVVRVVRSQRTYRLIVGTTSHLEYFGYCDMALTRNLPMLYWYRYKEVALSCPYFDLMATASNYSASSFEVSLTFDP